ncbi:MAG: acetate--CoA ligase family protein, partial [Candidatus Bipolaricaulota bacterium]|nr:acetate--CoA ligase family protein [Candidatus Bipolaricaulota bacterium]
MPRDLAEFLHPRSIAVVGASGSPKKIGGVLFANVATFPGPVYAVNPGHRELLGRPCVPTVDDLPEPVSLAVIIVPPPDALEALRACGRKGIRNAVVITAGFREVGGEGADRERELVRIAQDYGLNVLGPNAFGLVLPRRGLNATFAPRGARPGGIAFLSQSGALGSAVLHWAWERGVGFSAFVSLGNKAVLGEVDFLPALAADPETRAVALYLEGVEDGREFVRVAGEVAREKPVVVLKAGRSEAGARAASSHTGALAGADRAYDAAFQRAGVLRVGTVEELFEVAQALAGCPLPRGRRLGIVTNAGGPGILAADAAAEVGLEVPPLAPATTAALAPKVSPAASLRNPVDILADATGETFRDALDAVLADPGVDLGLVLTAPHPILTFAELARILAESRAHGKPLAACFMAGDLGEEAEGILERAGIPHFFEPARAVRALAALAQYREIRDRPPEREIPSPRRRSAVEPYLSGRERLGVEALPLLAEYGVPIARGGMARSAGEAAELARALGERVVLKAVAPGLLHKSDAGGVRIGVPGAEVSAAARELLQAFPGAAVCVQELLPPGVEVVVGGVRDPTFGPLVMFGLGGVFVEVLEDVAFALAPLSLGEAEELSLIHI